MSTNSWPSRSGQYSAGSHQSVGGSVVERPPIRLPTRQPWLVAGQRSRQRRRVRQSAQLEPCPARASLAEFVKAAWHVLEPSVPLIWNWHMDVICAHLQAVTEGHLTRLLINVPPGHSKSLIVSCFWPAWIWLLKPSHRLLCCSSTLTLAIRDSGRCKELIESDWYQETFAPSWGFSRDTRAKSTYKNTARGERRCASVGATITGFRAEILIIDDPLQMMDSLSERKREEANTWLDKAANNRVANPTTSAIVMIAQRLHHEDPCGHVLQRKKNPFQHVCLPTYFEKSRAFRTCLADIPEYSQWGTDPRQEEGELLFPQFFTPDAIEEAEETLQELGFAAQHQQRPTPHQGNIFKAEMFCKKAPGPQDNPDTFSIEFWPLDLIFNQRIIEAYFSWDTAMKEKTYNDFTAGCLSLLAEDGYVYLLPIEFMRLEVPKVEKRVALEWVEWKSILKQSLQGARIEEGAGTSLVQYLRRLMAARRDTGTRPAGWAAEDWEKVRMAPPLNPMPYGTGGRSKVERAMAVLPFCAGGNVRLLESRKQGLSKSWLENLLGFPLAGRDDPVDASVAAIEPFAEVGAAEPAMTREEWEAGAAEGPQ